MKANSAMLPNMKIRHPIIHKSMPKTSVCDSSCVTFLLTHNLCIYPQPFTPDFAGHSQRNNFVPQSNSNPSLLVFRNPLLPLRYPTLGREPTKFPYCNIIASKVLIPIVARAGTAMGFMEKDNHATITVRLFGMYA